MYCEMFNVLGINTLHRAIIYLMFTVILFRFSFWALREAQELSFPLTESLSETQVFVTTNFLNSERHPGISVWDAPEPATTWSGLKYHHVSLRSKEEGNETKSK